MGRRGRERNVRSRAPTKVAGVCFSFEKMRRRTRPCCQVKKFGRRFNRCQRPKKKKKPLRLRQGRSGIEFHIGRPHILFLYPPLIPKFVNHSFFFFSFPNDILFICDLCVRVCRSTAFLFFVFVIILVLLEKGPFLLCPG